MHRLGILLGLFALSSASALAQDEPRGSDGLTHEERRQRDQRRARERLEEIRDDDFREGAEIGEGDTASAIDHEKQTGRPTRRGRTGEETWHFQKGEEFETRYGKWLEHNRRHADPRDVRFAERQLERLRDARMRRPSWWAARRMRRWLEQNARGSDDIERALRHGSDDFFTSLRRVAIRRLGGAGRHLGKLRRVGRAAGRLLAYLEAALVLIDLAREKDPSDIILDELVGTAELMANQQYAWVPGWMRERYFTWLRRFWKSRLSPLDRAWDRYCDWWYERVMGGSRPDTDPPARRPRGGRKAADWYEFEGADAHIRGAGGK